MTVNPELRRNLWLELTPHRLIAMPAILVLGLTLAYILGRPDAAQAVAWVALGLFLAISWLWGSQLAANSIVDEFREKTWDTQRMSSLGPWALAWGKLVGANVFTWYGGAICLLVFVVFGNAARMPITATILLAGGGAVLIQALSMLFALVAGAGVRHRHVPTNLLVILLAVVFFGRYVSTLYGREPIIWYGMSLNPTWFGAVSVWTFAIWAAVGVYRVLCAELQVRTMPVAWLGFAAFLSLYLAGFTLDVLPGRSHSLLLLCAFAVTLSMTYLSAWWEPRDVVTVRRFALHWRESARKRALQEMPCWLATAPFAIAFALLLLLTGPLLPVGRLPAGFAIGLCLYALRDIGLLYFFSLARKPRRAELAAGVYLVVAYWLLPEIFGAVGSDVLSKAFLPPIWRETSTAIGILLLHLGLVGGLLWWRWKSYHATVAEAA